MNDKTIIEKKIGHSTWIDITNPTLEKLQPFQKKYNLHQADINAILDNNIISKTYEHNNYLFIVIYANAINQDGKIIFQKFDILFSKRYIITVHSKPNVILTKLFQNNPEEKYHNSAHILYHILKNVNESHSITINYLAEKINKLELDISSTHKYSKQLIIDQILSLRKDLLSLLNIFKPNELVCKGISKSNILKISFPTYIAHIDSVAKSQERNYQLIQHYVNTIDGLINIVNIIISNRFNDIIRILTIVSVALLPLTLFAGILGMNFPSIIFNTPYGFFISIFLMILLEIIILNYFKYKKWL
jgi:magnesium transporter